MLWKQAFRFLSLTLMCEHATKQFQSRLKGLRCVAAHSSWGLKCSIAIFMDSEHAPGFRCTAAQSPRGSRCSISAFMISGHPKFQTTVGIHTKVPQMSKSTDSSLFVRSPYRLKAGPEIEKVDLFSEKASYDDSDSIADYCGFRAVWGSILSQFEECFCGPRSVRPSHQNKT